MHDTNVLALLEAVAHAEGTAQKPDPFRVCYGYRHTIVSFAGHPFITREWSGETLPPAMCAAAGFGPGCISTAAGKFQINAPTWRDFAPRVKATDFSPANQVLVAVELLKVTGAWQLVRAGQFAAAVHAARKRWASLPGSGWQQPERSLAYLQAVYTRHGGVLA